MKAFICDRCGKIDFDEVDLCPACCAAFEKWWEQCDTSVE